MKYTIGETFGEDNLPLLEIVGTDASRNILGKFKCVCGKEFITRITAIASNSSRGYGCRRGNFIHGLRYHSLYNTYTLIKKRCYNKNDKLYKYYGAKGIEMSEEFKDNPQAFINYISSLPKYEDRMKYGLSIDRIDNYKGYE